MMTWKGGVPTHIIFYEIIFLKEAAKAWTRLDGSEGEKKGKET